MADEVMVEGYADRWGEPWPDDGVLMPGAITQENLDRLVGSPVTVEYDRTQPPAGILEAAAVDDDGVYVHVRLTDDEVIRSLELRDRATVRVPYMVERREFKLGPEGTVDRTFTESGIVITHI